MLPGPIVLLLLMSAIDAAVSDYRDAIILANELWKQEALFKYSGIHFPEHYNYKPTPSTVVNEHLEKHYVKFLQRLREFHHSEGMNRLVDQGLGAALPIFFALENHHPTVLKSHEKGRWEANLVQPLLDKRRFLKCIIRKFDLITCLEHQAREERKEGVDLEIFLLAVHFVQQAMDIAQSGSFLLAEADLKKLRSDCSAIALVREWDRFFTIPRVLYLNFILHARSLISVVTKNTDERLSVSNILLSLKQTMENEFPNHMLTEVRRERIQCLVTLSSIGFPRKQVQVEEIILGTVMQRLRIDKTPIIFLKDTWIYVTVPKFYGENDPQELERLFTSVIEKLSGNNFVLHSNPVVHKK